MKSKTSFFNLGLFKSNLKRYWPLWTAHFALWFFMLPIIVLMSHEYTELASNRAVILLSGYSSEFAVMFAFCMAVLSAMAMYSFMYTSRGSGLIASLPVSREAVFGSAYLAGLLPVIASNIVIALLTFLFSLGRQSDPAMVLKAAAIWFTVYSIEYILFYSIAALTAMVTGNIIAMPVLYIIFNFFFVGMEFIIRLFLSIFVWGLPDSVSYMSLTPLSPVLYLATLKFMPLKYEETVSINGMLNNYVDKASVSFQDWHILLIYLAVAIVLTAAALLLFRKHKMESAGDVVSVPWMRPVFKYGLTVCAALCGGMLLFAIFYYESYQRSAPLAVIIMILCMAVGALVGYFGSEMLLKKSFHVFKRGWKGYIITALVCAVFVVCCSFDVLGIGKTVPNPDKVESINVLGEDYSVDISDPDLVSKFVGIHRNIVNDRDKYTGFNENNCSEDVLFRYSMKDGSYLERRYYIADDKNYKDYLSIIYSPEFQLELFSPSIPVDIQHCEGAYFYAYTLTSDGYTDTAENADLTPEQTVDFYENALLPDIRSGKKVIGVGNDDSHIFASLEIYLTESKIDVNADSTSLYVRINDDCENCIQWIKDNLGVDLKALDTEVTQQ